MRKQSSNVICHAGACRHHSRHLLQWQNAEPYIPLRQWLWKGCVVQRCAAMRSDPVVRAVRSRPDWFESMGAHTSNMFRPGLLNTSRAAGWSAWSCSAACLRSMVACASDHLFFSMKFKSSPFSWNFSDIDLYEAWVVEHQRQIKIGRQAL